MAEKIANYQVRWYIFGVTLFLFKIVMPLIVLCNNHSDVQDAEKRESDVTM